MRAVYVRNIIFGIADSLVSTVGLLSGIAVAGSSHSAIILTGIVYAFVESLSMAVGSFLSEEAAEEFASKKENKSSTPVIGAVVMFVSFLVSSFVPIFPYLIVQTSAALGISIALSLIALFVVGLIVAGVSRVRLLRHAIKMLILGGAAILIGVLVGTYVHIT